MKWNRSCYLFMSWSVLALAVGAAADVWQESGDAGDLYLTGYQTPMGVGPLTQISGAYGGEDDPVDVFRIRITDVEAFYATTDPNYDPDAEGSDTFLILYDLEGNPLVGNQDQFGVQSIISHPSQWTALTGDTNFVDDPQAFEPGEYLLMVGEWLSEPVDADGDDVINLQFIDPIAWDGLRGLNPQWDGFAQFGPSVIPDVRSYTIALAGVEFAAVPEPGALALLVFSGLVLLRRN